MHYQDLVEPQTRQGSVLHVGAPNVGDREYFDRIVDGIFDRRWFTNNGAVVQELERRLCDYLDVRHCVCVSNATTGPAVGPARA